VGQKPPGREFGSKSSAGRDADSELDVPPVGRFDVIGSVQLCGCGVELP